MTDRQITFAERYTVGLLHRQGQSPATIAHSLGRHRSAIYRQLQRNSAIADGSYRPQLAQWYAKWRHRYAQRPGLELVGRRAPPATVLKP